MKLKDTNWTNQTPFKKQEILPNECLFKTFHLWSSELSGYLERSGCSIYRLIISYWFWWLIWFCVQIWFYSEQTSTTDQTEKITLCCIWRTLSALEVLQVLIRFCFHSLSMVNLVPGPNRTLNPLSVTQHEAPQHKPDFNQTLILVLIKVLYYYYWV